eukprot:5229779-Pyramimonas_sp.AAC.1
MFEQSNHSHAHIHACPTKCLKTTVNLDPKDGARGCAYTVELNQRPGSELKNYTGGRDRPEPF